MDCLRTKERNDLFLRAFGFLRDESSLELGLGGCPKIDVCYDLLHIPPAAFKIPETPSP